MIHKVESGTKIISPERIRWCGLTDKERPDWEQEVVDALRSPMSIAFVNELNAELSKINTFFLKTSAELAERLDALPPVEMSSHAEIQRITADVGRVSSKLREFSVVNFTGTVKILKKHDKNSGASLRSVYVRRVLEVQPFHVQLGQIVRRVVGIREEVDRLTPTLDDSFMRISSIRPGFNRDLNNDIMVDVTVKKEALCVVVRNSGKEILAIRDEGSLSAHLVKAVLESGESTADAAIRGVQDTAGELVHLERRLGEFKSATRTNTVYDAYLLVSTGVDPNWSNPCNITKLWLSPEQALVSVQDNSSLRVIRSVLES
uniref:SPX domain-containing protein n=2 Tax=Compsopogon caeruleus TaxID=31354 RepID=A0A7S1XCD6_9RHOD